MKNNPSQDYPGSVAIIVAGGEGKRFGGEIPKQFLNLKGFPIIFYSIKFFEEIDEISGIILVIHQDWMKRVKKWVEEWGFKKVIGIVKGGETRKESVLAGLRSVPAKRFSIILIHDAVRPFPPREQTLKAIKIAGRGEGAILACQASDTVKEAEDEFLILKTLERRKIWLAQTPQVFPFDKLLMAYEECSKLKTEITDDASVFELFNYPVRIVPSTQKNIKITYEEDILIAETLSAV